MCVSWNLQSSKANSLAIRYQSSLSVKYRNKIISLNSTGRIDSVCCGTQGIYITQALFIISSKTIAQYQQGDCSTEPSRALSQSEAVQGKSIKVNELLCI